METKTFLRRALGSEGYYCVFAFRPSDERRMQKFYDSIDAVIDAAHNFDQEGYDAYFALATLKEAGNRRVDNVKQLKSFFLDLDCGPSKDFTSQGEAVKKLRQFCKDTGLPRPLMVNSGRGVHVYWTFTEEVSYADWVPVAERLKRLCDEKGFGADPAVTADGARVLRVPSTRNFKTDPPSVVTVWNADPPPPVDFDKFSELLGSDPIPVPTKFEAIGSNAVMDALIGNKQSVFKDIMLKTMMGRGCTQLGALVKNQAETSEPLWRAGLSIAKFCVDADKAIHKISKGHEEYTPQKTYKKVEQIKGPYTCVKFDEFNPNVCPDCPFWGKIKSPIVLGQKIKEATEEDNVVEAPDDTYESVVYNIPTYPNPYFRGANGGVYLRTRNADGELDEKSIYHNDLYVTKRIRDVELGESIVMRLHLPQDGVREFTVPLTSVTSKEEFRRAMAREGVAITDMGELMAYTTQWIHELQASSKAANAHRQFGWTDNNMKSFVLGDREYFPSHSEANPPASNTAGLFTAFKPEGTLEDWKYMVDFFNKDGFECQQFVIGAGFGSVLMELSPIHCANFHMWGDTGVGKTTAALAALSIWGNPEDLLLQERDTYNHKMNRGEVYKNLFMVMDELTNSPGKVLSDITYHFTGGKQRGRMAGGANVERSRGESWRLLALTTGNTSMVDRIALYKAMPRAEAQRILEYHVTSQVFESKAETDAFSQAIVKNYGFAGPVYIQWLMSNMDEVKRVVAKVQGHVDKDANLKAENRFWSAYVTHAIAGLILAKQAGLVNYDTSKTYQWALRLLEDNKRRMLDMGASTEDLINDFFNEHWGSVLVIKGDIDLRKDESDGLNSIIIPENMPRGKLVARYETDTHKAFIVPKVLKAWCGDQQINYSAFVNDLINKLGAKRMKMRLSKGTHLNLPPQDVISFESKIERPDETGSIDDL